jgi:hypothetical protein
MVDFNTITEKNESEAKAKFRENGTGVKMGTFASGDESKWEDLINTGLFSNQAIKNRMLDFARRINTMCNDELLGNLDVAFTVTDARDNKVEFTYMDIYTFLRAAYRYRSETKNYREMKARKAELEKFTEETKTVKEKRAEALKELKELEKSLV